MITAKSQMITLQGNVLTYVGKSVGIIIIQI